MPKDPRHGRSFFQLFASDNPDAQRSPNPLSPMLPPPPNWISGTDVEPRHNCRGGPLLRGGSCPPSCCGQGEATLPTFTIFNGLPIQSGTAGRYAEEDDDEGTMDRCTEEDEEEDEVEEEDTSSDAAAAGPPLLSLEGNLGGEDDGVADCHDLVNTQGVLCVLGIDRVDPLSQFLKGQAEAQGALRNQAEVQGVLRGCSPAGDMTAAAAAALCVRPTADKRAGCGVELGSAIGVEHGSAIGSEYEFNPTPITQQDPTSRFPLARDDASGVKGAPASASRQPAEEAEGGFKDRTPFLLRCFSGSPT